ncbi:MAG: hypothetical protein ACP5E2_16630 [Terracidiphilus sp.]
MHTDLLELPQRLIAFARIGMRPSPADVEAAIRHVDRAQAAMRSSGQSAAALDSARAALISLRWGHLPNRDVCISAVSSLGAIMALGSAMEDA